jgi:transcriptional regulator with XRE-family HTH domain
MRVVNIRNIRREHGVSETENAEALGVSRGKVAHVEHGRSEMRVSEVRRWAKAYGVTVPELCAHIEYLAFRGPG